MRRLTKTLLSSLMVVALTSCAGLDIFGGNDYSGYAEYFEQELKYSKYNDMDSLNEAIAKENYFWTMDDADKYTAYYTGKSALLLVYKNESCVSASFIDGTSLYIRVKNDEVIASINDYYAEINITTGEKTIEPGHEDDLDVAEDNGGYLIVSYQKHMIYVTKDFKKAYINENNTKVFQGYEETKIIPESDLLNNTLAALGEDERVKLPAPGDEYEIWYGMDYYHEHKSHGTAYIADVHPEDYAKVLKQNGFTVIRSWEDPFYTFYGDDGGYWYCYDENEEISVILSLQNYLYTNSKGKTYGPWENTNIWFYRMSTGYFGEKRRTTNEGWTDYDKERMEGWYDGTIDATKVPFIQLAESYMIPRKDLMTSAHYGLMDGTLKLHSKCYNICDNSPYYFLDGYDEILESNGFHKYVPQYDLSNSDEKKAFENTEECKYVECFINDELDIAIKYYFDISSGNTIRVFKKSEMKSWLQDEK